MDEFGQLERKGYTRMMKTEHEWLGYWRDETVGRTARRTLLFQMELDTSRCGRGTECSPFHMNIRARDRSGSNVHARTRKRRLAYIK